MKIVAIVGFVFIGLGGLVGLSMLPDIIHHVNYYGQQMEANQLFELVWCSAVLVAFFVCAILYVVADRLKKTA